MNTIRVVEIITPEVADPKKKNQILDRLAEDELTYELGVEAAEAGINFFEWPYRCVAAKEFKLGWGSAVTFIPRDDLTVKNHTIVSKNID